MTVTHLSPAMLVCALVLSSCTAGELPMRADCIAGAQLMWPDATTEDEKVTILNQVAAFRVSRIAPSSGIRIQDREAIYVIFNERCELKGEFMSAYMDHLSNEIPKFPEYELIQEVIQPGSDTILTYGEYWRDGTPPAHWLPQ